jgi:spore maturation protein CgeB
LTPQLTSIRLLFVCNEDRATSFQRRLALTDLGISFDIILTSRLDAKIPLLKKIFRAISFRLGYFPERNNENYRIKESISKQHYQILFIEKGLSIRPSTLAFVKKVSPGTRILSYTLDDILNKHNSSRYYFKSLPLYDFHFTNKKFNVKELENAGAGNVVYFRNSYSPHVHRPVSLTETDREYYGCNVSFIGTAELERADYLMFLATHGIKIKIWGWSRPSGNSGIDHPNITNMNKHVYDDEYAKVICASKINLCFLRKSNRDTETTRSIEIPACGGFMLAERTDDHLELFTESLEVEYFSSKQELLDKIIYFLANDVQREQIAGNGYHRCINSDYSYNRQLTEILGYVLKNG